VKEIDSGANPTAQEIGIIVSVILFTAGYILTNRQKEKAKVANDVTILSDKLIAQLGRKIEYYSKRTTDAKTEPEVFEDFIIESSFADDYKKILKADKSIKKDVKDLSALFGIVKRIRAAAYKHFPDKEEADRAIEQVLSGANNGTGNKSEGIEEFYIQNIVDLEIAEKDESIYEMIVGKCITLKDKILEVRNEYRGKAYQPKKPGTDSNW
jgi:hypothetical protein